MLHDNSVLVGIDTIETNNVRNTETVIIQQDLKVHASHSKLE